MTVEDRHPVFGPGSNQTGLREAPWIETERLRLRPFHIQDLDAMAAMWTREEVVRHIGGKPVGREDVWRRALTGHAQWALLGYGYWIAERKSDGRFVGQLGFADFKRDMQPSIEGEPEMGWVFDSSVHGQGIAGEACKAALEWADAELRVGSYPAIIALENVPSMRLAERLGFARMPDAIYNSGSIALYRRLARN